MTAATGDATPYYLDKAEPAVFEAMSAVAKEIGAAAERAGVGIRTVELVNLRVSQVNGCAYCLDVHHRRALKHGEDPRRLAVLDAWEDTDLFDERERAALELAEAMTGLPPAAERREVEDRTRAVLGEDAYGVVAWVVVAMNAFNRVSITSRHPVG